MKDLIELLDKAINAKDVGELADMLEEADDLFSDEYMEQTIVPFMIVIRRAVSDAKYAQNAMLYEAMDKNDLYVKSYAIAAKKGAEAAREILEEIMKGEDR